MKQNATYMTLSMNSIIVRGGGVYGYVSIGYKEYHCFSKFERQVFLFLYPPLETPE